MIINLYSVYDVKADSYNNVIQAVNDDVAIRDFTLVVRDPESLLHQFPDHFILTRIGSFDTNEGMIASNNPITIFSANAVLKEDERHEV